MNPEYRGRLFSRSTTTSSSSNSDSSGNVGEDEDDSRPDGVSPPSKRLKTEQVDAELCDLYNDENAPVNFTRGRPLLYCNRFFVVPSNGNNSDDSDDDEDEDAPRSFRRCDHGNQCPSCVRLQTNPATCLEILRRLFRGIVGGDVTLFGVLRRSYGSVSRAADLLQSMGGRYVDWTIALSSCPNVPPPSRPPLTEAEKGHVQAMTETLGVTNLVAELAYVRNGRDANRAAEWILSNRDAAQRNADSAAETEAREASAWREKAQRNNARREVSMREAVQTNAALNLHSLPKGDAFSPLLRGGVSAQSCGTAAVSGMFATQPPSMMMDETEDNDNARQQKSEQRCKTTSKSDAADADEDSSVAPPPVIITQHGHRMVRVYAAGGLDGSAHRQSSPVRCILCTSPSSSETFGSYWCQACRLCEGCVQSTDPTVHRCPGLANGGHLHHHPLSRTEGRQEGEGGSGACTVRGEGCLGAAAFWSCKQCPSSFCGVCMAKPVPNGFHRRLGMVIVEEEESGNGERGRDHPQPRRATSDLFGSDDSDSDYEEVEPIRRSNIPRSNIHREDVDDATEANDRHENQLLLPGVRPFDEDAAKRDVAARWEGMAEAVQRQEAASGVDGGSGGQVLGSGAVRATESGTDGGTSRDQGQRGRPRNRRNQNSQRQNARRSVTENGGKLSHEAAEALNRYRNQPVDGKSSMAPLTSATDVTHVEDLLRRAETVDDRLTVRAMREAIAAGRVGIAGTLLLSQSYAPSVTPGEKVQESVDSSENAANGEINGDDGETKKCWCGDVIDSKTAPDGSVGCLGGHAMHASCAADLLLGGGLCPTCRQPLFFSRVVGPEVKAAVEHVNEEKRRVEREEEEKVKAELDDLARRGLEVKFNVNDVVRVSADKDHCARLQMEDPLSGGWSEDMSEACGSEGSVMDVTERGGRIVSIRVRTRRGRSHSYQLLERFRNYTCPTCHNAGPSAETGRCGCSQCMQCAQCCCGSSGDCPQTIHEWAWNPSLLVLVRRSSRREDGQEENVDAEASGAAVAAERHVARLRGELVAVKAAREAVKAETDQFMSSFGLKKIGRELSTNSRAAIRDVIDSSGISPADWQRARHLLLLARQWGDSNEAKSKRATLYAAVRNGDLDSVARIVRRYNMARTIEAARWEDAATATADYIVDPTTVVTLRCFPQNFAPKTGFQLEPNSQFASRREILDDKGNVWLQVAAPHTDDPATFDGTRVTGSSRSLVGARVKRGENWRYGEQDGGEGNEGVITQVLTKEVVVRWDGNENAFRYRSSKDGPWDLLFVDAPPPPPQGWLCVRPGGAGSPAVVARSNTALRCFGCGDRLIPPQFSREKFSTVKRRTVRQGDQLLVAATLERVIVESLVGGRIFCSFPNTEAGEACDSNDAQDGAKDVTEVQATGEIVGSGVVDKVSVENSTRQSRLTSLTQRVKSNGEKVTKSAIWYRAVDLVFPDAGGDEHETEDATVTVDGQTRTRRELVLMCGGDEDAARATWNEAIRKERGKSSQFEDEAETGKFASCARGHLLHARCLQEALLAGRRCPASGCIEPLWVPSVTRTRNNDDATCCGGDRGEEAEAAALQEASELAGHAAIVEARARQNAVGDDREYTSAGFSSLKMCPVCCAGPLFNTNCSDMQAHHGQCTVSALGRGSRQQEECTDNGPFRASASDIAKCMTQVSSSRSVADVLPRCPTHNVLVMFNGCMACGHLFTDTSWGDMPKWDPRAKALLELDEKKRNAARLLAEQVRKEAALLQFERDALLEARAGGIGISLD